MSETSDTKPITIYIDADACPVKDEAYRVAERYGLRIFVVANAYFRVPRNPMIEQIVVSDGFDTADDWIAERAGEGDIVITADIPLASRCVKAGACVISPTGKPFDETSIGMALATRDLMDDLRSQLANRVQLTTDGHKAYLEAVEGAFGGDIDYEKQGFAAAAVLRGPSRRTPAGWAERQADYVSAHSRVLIDRKLSGFAYQSLGLLNGMGFTNGIFWPALSKSLMAARRSRSRTQDASGMPAKAAAAAKPCFSSSESRICNTRSLAIQKT